MEKQLLRMSEAAEALSISRAYLYELLDQGLIGPKIHVGTRAVRLHANDVRRFAEQQRQVAQDAGAA